MSKVHDTDIGVARVYSRALLGLAAAQGQAEEILDELGEIAGYAQRDLDFATFVASPLVDMSERAAVLEKLFRGRASDLLVDALQVLNRKERLALLPAVLETYRVELQDRSGRVDVHVRSAVPLSEASRQRLAAVVEQRFGKKADFIEAVDPSLIGGLVVQIGDQKIDGSVVRKIRTLHELLEERAAREIHRSRLTSEVQGAEAP